MQGVMSSLDRAWRNQSRLDSLVGDQGFGTRQRGQDGRAAAIIAARWPAGDACIAERVALGEQQNQWLAVRVADGVQLGGQAPFGPPDAAGKSPFLRKLAEVRCALRRASVDHHGLRRGAFGGQSREYPIEHADPAPSDEPVVKCLVRTVGGGDVAPHQPVADHMDDPADHPAVIDARHASRLIGQKRLQTQELSFCKPEVVIGHGKPRNGWEIWIKTGSQWESILWVLTLIKAQACKGRNIEDIVGWRLSLPIIFSLKKINYLNFLVANSVFANLLATLYRVFIKMLLARCIYLKNSL
ncbi:MAG: hypothetical protein ACI807_002189 [Paracoccaceae bacterium]|jgi:hypothetical protein